ncbi:Olfactory receptor 7G1 [Fukomys damarensis]|uniref:Olfactory receptor n=1 Tax=Fukomys damarensis TaxID=885580 RepID=A0A091CNL8_FUKDA|nr:Olfactory receptor 7G1 [Fukomys damarensis]
MEATNQTAASEFNLLGLTDDAELQPLIFSLFLSIYLVTILGNLLIIFVFSFESHLHNPMYFFLCVLSFNDICSSTSTIPKMLVNIQLQRQSITYTGCFTQTGFVITFAFLENFLLAVMAYDRYAAICRPLRYTVIMNPHFCVLLVLVSLLISMADSLIHTLMTLRLSFCTDLDIPHFFCELAQVLHTLMALRLSFCTDLDIPHFFCELAQLIKLACSDTVIDNILIYISCGICVGIPLSGIIYSYFHIVSSVLRMSSSGGKYKAFSTCGSHLSVVSLFYGTGFGVYISAAVTDSPRKTAVASVMYSLLPQMLNPFIYSLRNKDMKEALRRIVTSNPSLL